MSRLLSIIIDYIPQDKMDKVSVSKLCDWNIFLFKLEQERKLSFSDVYDYLDKELDKIK